MSYLVFLAIGLGIVWFGLRTREEVVRLASTISGAIFLVWGFAITPLPFQLLVEVLAVIAVFSVCVRCLRA